MSEHNHEHGPDCGCGEEEPSFIITDENGVDHEMIMVYTFESADRNYAVLLEKDEPEAEGLIFRIEEEGDDVYLVTIDDDAEWEQVVEVYNRLAEEEA
ncbi:DUF1292 domain-containing protein [Xylanibacillus composti]|uniref:Uncharacterized protein n=1 Tax=Xylanibacillus composti TaxID=1572762 RepID=A0A8J4H418_9BACL|nr:DUF1292 domain-containing protein [Xylanibacillus composti]MDT9724197.1 DUF1292 domain-containing protein [Xylanibacillus composti]GIQ68288.1 hypothetical protein XYCOK13_11120 [Xylanibacillus composti]